MKLLFYKIMYVNNENCDIIILPRKRGRNLCMIETLQSYQS
jgi:hypothetical protein